MKDVGTGEIVADSSALWESVCSASDVLMRASATKASCTQVYSRGVEHMVRVESVGIIYCMNKRK